jgi:hypothetical protein
MRPGAVEVWGGNVRLAAEPCRTLASVERFWFVEDSIGTIGIFNNRLFLLGTLPLALRWGSILTPQKLLK